jgi:hypothetical protein
MRNWKTTTCGIVVAFSGFVAYTPENFGGKENLLVKLCTYITLGGLAALGFVAKDAK